MDGENVVREVVVSEGGVLHKATYFVENGIVHARIDEKTLLVQAGRTGAEDIVRALLVEHLTEQRLRRSTKEAWARLIEQRPRGK